MRTEDTTLDDLMRPGLATDFFARRTLAPFDPNATTFTVANALWLMELSRIVYRHDVEEPDALVPPRSAFLKRAGLRQVKFFNGRRRGTQAMLVRGDQFAVLAFRGTEQEPKDLITDINFRSKDVSGDDVHAGFAEALDIVWPDIEAELKKVDVPLFYTGHSLGAALATLAAFKHAPRATYTFGSPRVGKAKFAAALQGAPIFRIVDDLDIVTTVPLEAMGFVHVGSEHQLKEVPEPKILLHVKKKFTDHAPVNYVDRLG